MSPGQEGGSPLVGGPTEDQLERALALAFRHLNRRERTCREMREHLSKRGIEPSAVEAAIHELTGQGYLDDCRFARVFAEDKRALSGWGSARIRRELVARGVDREHIDDALAAHEDRAQPAEGELERARALMRRRFPEGVTSRRDRERALAVLLRKGYEYDLAARALGGAGEDS